MNGGRGVMPTRILIVGSGGREHALAWQLAAEPGVNDGDRRAGQRCHRVGTAGPGGRVDPLDGASVVAAAREAAELVVIGPEAPLAAGSADALRGGGIADFGPTAAAARIEASKAFCHEIAEAAGVPMAEAGRSTRPPTRAAYAHELAAVARRRGQGRRARGGQGRDGLRNAGGDEALSAMRRRSRREAAPWSSRNGSSAERPA